MCILHKAMKSIIMNENQTSLTIEKFKSYHDFSDSVKIETNCHLLCKIADNFQLTTSFL